MAHVVVHGQRTGGTERLMVMCYWPWNFPTPSKHSRYEAVRSDLLSMQFAVVAVGLPSGVDFF